MSINSSPEPSSSQLGGRFGIVFAQTLSGYWRGKYSQRQVDDLPYKLLNFRNDLLRIARGQRLAAAINDEIEVFQDYRSD